MGKGRTSFRLPAIGVGALCVALVAGCRSDGGSDDLRPLLKVEDAGMAPGIEASHRFGRWLEVRSVPGTAETLQLAALEERDGKSELAIEILSKALDDGPPNAALLEARGALYLSTGYPRAAAGDFQRAVGLDPRSAGAWYALGHSYEVLGLLNQAFDALKKAVELGEEVQGLFVSLARVQHGRGHDGLAAAAYFKAIERIPGPSIELLAEAAALALAPHELAVHVDSQRERLETCLGTQVSADAWLLRALVRELDGESPAEVAAAFQALEIGSDELETLVRNDLLALQLIDPETSASAREALLASVSDEARRTALERCLARP